MTLRSFIPIQKPLNCVSVFLKEKWNEKIIKPVPGTEQSQRIYVN
jgi:hypothetical protein